MRIRLNGTFTAVSTLILAAVAAGIIGTTSPGGGGTAPSGTANVWVNVITGGNPSRASAPASYNASNAYGNFSNACAAAQPGDTIGVAGGSYPTQNIQCTKALTYRLEPTAKVLSLVFFTGAANFRVTGGIATGCNECSTGQGFNNPQESIDFIRTSNIRVDHMTLYQHIYFESATGITFDHNEITPDTTLTSADCDGGPSGTNYCGAPFHTTWVNGDMLNIYEQNTAYPANSDITISDNVFHGLRSANAADDPDTVHNDSQHSDVIQFCNCGPTTKFATNVRVLRNRFYDNECINLRANPKTGVDIERNLFGTVVVGYSGCGDYSLDAGMANATVKYNTFLQGIQSTSIDYGQSQTWVGNAVVGKIGAGCEAVNATYTENVYTQGSACGSGDVVTGSLNINSTTGVPNSGSPLINAGLVGDFPSPDLAGVTSPTGAPDAGAFEVG